MFTSLFQLEQKPVTVFSGADAGAPILTKDPGSLKTILKACLVTGYGSKASLGWEMGFESEDQLKAAFKSTDPTASRFYFKIDNSGSSSALLSGYQDMSSIDVGVNPTVVNNSYALHQSNWALIGHSKAFILLLDIPASGGSKCAYPLFFGDLPRELKRIAPVCALWSGRISSRGSTGGLQSTLLRHTEGRTDVNAGSGTISAGVNYPVVVNGQTGGENIKSSFCRFSLTSNIPAEVLYEPFICALEDSTWTMIPMLQPMSARVSAVGNLGLLSSTAIKAVTGEYGMAENNDCAVPTDWWYA